MNESSRGGAAEIPRPEQSVARQLRLLRQAHSWSQLEVAERMRAYGYQWSQATVTRLEAASRPIRVNELIDLAALYDVPVAQFLEPGAPDSDLADLEEEIKRLTAERDVLAERLHTMDAAAHRLAQTRATTVALMARIDGRMEILSRWRRPPAAKEEAASEPAQP